MKIGDLYQFDVRKFRSESLGYVSMIDTMMVFCYCNTYKIRCLENLVVDDSSIFLLLKVDADRGVGTYFMKGHIFRALHKYMKRIKE